MICQSCGVEAPTKYVSFHQNIGALLMRFSKSIEGKLCKDCIHQRFWSTTGTTLFLGWWGTISFIITPFLLLNNIIRYLTCLGMAPVPPGAVVPVLTDEAARRINPHAQGLFDALQRGEDLHTAATRAATAAGTTPGQVILFARAVIDEQQRQAGK